MYHFLSIDGRDEIIIYVDCMQLIWYQVMNEYACKTLY